MSQDKTTKKEVIRLPSFMTVRELAERLNLPVTDIISALMKNGVSASVNENIDYETAAVVALDLGFQTKLEESSEKDTEGEKSVASGDLVPRPPIVTVMGHVNHGKTLLLDAIRETNVVASESGGITQHIGAYQVNVGGKMITFLDTPGHEAFAAMRARGASVTDIVVLVVAADDKVQPQTLESIKHAQEASLPIIVAINKIDLPNARPEKIKRELSEHGLVAEDLGGKTICVPVSAKTKEGISELLEMILLVAEMEELKANTKTKACGVVLESHIDKGKGVQATILIKEGTLKLMDNFVVGEQYGKVRTMENFLGERIKKAGPSTPVVISGFSNLPNMGDILRVVSDEQEAKEEAAKIIKARRIKRLSSFKRLPQKEKEYELKIVLKADVGGSLEAIEEELNKIGTEKVGVNLLKAGIGDITESDVLMASLGKGVILGFHNKITPAARKLAKQKNVKIHLYKVIYELVDDVKKMMLDLLPPQIKEISEGRLKVLQIFRAEKTEFILGGKVISGRLIKNSKARVLRGNQVIGEGVILNIKKVDKDVLEIKEGEECGIRFRGNVVLKTEDIMECIREEVLPKSL